MITVHIQPRLQFFRLRVPAARAQYGDWFSRDWCIIRKVMTDGATNLMTGSVPKGRERKASGSATASGNPYFAIKKVGRMMNWIKLKM